MLKFTELPGGADWLIGCTVIAGGARATVSVAVPLVALPPALETTHLYFEPLFAIVNVAVVHAANVAPEMALSVSYHWYERPVPEAVT